MARVKRGNVRTRKRASVLKNTKGMRGGLKNITRLAKTASVHAGAHAYKGRKDKKRTMRRLWQIRLNAAVREHDLSYSKFIGLLKANNIEIDRKVLSQIAIEYPEVFAQIVAKVKK